MNKKGLIGKILLVIGIIILIIGIIIGITAYQLYSLANLAKQETSNIQQQYGEIAKGNCEVVPSIENSMNNLINEMQNACKNPLISYIFTKQTVQTENLGTLNCETVPQIKIKASDSIAQIKQLCSNQTIINAIKKQTATTISKVA